MIRFFRFTIIIFFIFQDFTVKAQPSVLNNFTTYFYPYRYQLSKYGEENVLYLSINKYFHTPSPQLPGLRIHQIQDSLCGLFKVKQSIYTVKIKNRKEFIKDDYITTFDEKGRVASYTTPIYSQLFTYHEDSTIEKAIIKGQKFKILTGTYDKNNNLIRMICDDSLLILERKYEHGLLVQSRQSQDKNLGLTYKYGEGKYYMDLITFDLNYYPGTSLLKTIKQDNYTIDSFVYSKEQPDQLESINGLALIYNLKGKLIEYNLGEKRSQPGGYGKPVIIEHNNYKYNYLPDGNLKSIIRTGGYDFYSNYVYDEKGRLTGMNGNLGNTSFRYHENGLISELNGLKVEYTYY